MEGASSVHSGRALNYSNWEDSVEYSVKVVKMPVRFPDEDVKVRNVKYRAFDEMMYECGRLINSAFKSYCVFDSVEVINQRGDAREHPDTYVYRQIKKQATLVCSNTVQSCALRFGKVYFQRFNSSPRGGGGRISRHTATVLPFKKGSATIMYSTEKGQFIFELAGFKKRWPTAPLLEKLKITDFPSHGIGPIRMESCFSHKDHGHREVVRRIVHGELYMCDSSISKGKNGGYVVNISYKAPQREYTPVTGRVCGIDFGVVIPMYCALNDGPQRLKIGDGGVIKNARYGFAQARKRDQMKRGIVSKSVKWLPSKKESNWIESQCHAFSRQAVNFAVRNNAEVIHVEDLTSLRRSESDSHYKMLIWTPAKLLDMLTYKAKEYGIEVIKMNPRNTSKRCSSCGHIAKENRESQSKFVCKNCGTVMNADYNAARNIALASGDVLTDGYTVSAEAQIL